MRTSQKLLVPLWAGLLLLSGPVPTSAADDIGGLVVDYANGTLDLRAIDVPLDSLLQELADEVGLRLVQHVALDRHVSVNFESAALPDVLAELLAEDSYQLYVAVDSADDVRGNEPIPGALWIFARGAAFAPAATAYLEIALFEGSLAEKREAIRELGRLGTPEAIQVLSLALSDEHRAVRGLALEALSRIGGDDALAAIASMAAEADPFARGKAAQAIAMAGGDSARAYLDLALRDADPRVRAAAIESFVELNDERTRSLVRSALQDPDPKVRARAVDVLENLEDEAAFDALYPFE
mgnify:CR=1 FL=1